MGRGSNKLTIGVTDPSWLGVLRRQQSLSEVNFWSRGKTSFSMEEGELLLFKLKGKPHRIVGGGIFYLKTSLPVSVAWQFFGIGNGASTLEDLRALVRGPQNRHGRDFELQCRILHHPFFFREQDCINVDHFWRDAIQVAKKISFEEKIAARLWVEVLERMPKAHCPKLPGQEDEQPEPSPLAGLRRTPRLITARPGQGAFRAMILDNFGRRCAVSREATVPALEAAHIRPYATMSTDPDVHSRRNGLLLRSDIHNLFDSGYVTVTPDYKFRVSKRIHKEFKNGKVYYDMNKREIKDSLVLPDPKALEWHNDTVFLS